MEFSILYLFIELYFKILKGISVITLSLINLDTWKNTDLFATRSENIKVLPEGPGVARGKKIEKKIFLEKIEKKNFRL